MFIGNYTLKIKELCNSLVSINVNIDNEEMVQICLGGVAPWFGVIRCREDPVTRHGSRGGTAGVLDRKDSKLAQALAREDLRKIEREIEIKLLTLDCKKQVTRSIR